ncbi:MAG: helix-turn-helix transcriptional regulator [Polynucleobacter sp.]|jgi:transcriptional regulator with XRE-family HTH domain
MVSPAKDTTLLAKRLKTARERINISQMELGVRAGIDEYSASARINQYERGKHAPDFNTAKTLAKVLDIPTAYLYCEDDALAELIATFGQLTSSQKKAVLQYVKSL